MLDNISSEAIEVLGNALFSQTLSPFYQLHTLHISLHYFNDSLSLLPILSAIRVTIRELKLEVESADPDVVPLVALANLTSTSIDLPELHTLAISVYAPYMIHLLHLFSLENLQYFALRVIGPFPDETAETATCPLQRYRIHHLIDDLNLAVTQSGISCHCCPEYCDLSDGLDP